MILPERKTLKNFSVRDSSKVGERSDQPQIQGCSLQGDEAHQVTMILPAVGRHETRTGEKPMELITVSHPDSSLLGGRGANKAKDHAADAAVADAGVKACICIWREARLQQHR